MPFTSGANIADIPEKNTIDRTVTTTLPATNARSAATNACPNDKPFTGSTLRFFFALCSAGCAAGCGAEFSTLCEACGSGLDAGCIFTLSAPSCSILFSSMICSFCFFVGNYFAAGLNIILSSFNFLQR
jgi:hypothetical protein